VECLTEVVSRRVLLLTATLAGGGLERQLTLLATHLPSRWQPAIWSSDGGPFVEALRQSRVGLRIERRCARFDPLPFVSLARLIVTTRPDVVHAWHWLPNAVAAPVCRLVGVPLVDGTIRMGRRTREFGRPRRSLMSLANVVVANSQAGLQAWHVPPARGRVVYNGFDPMRLEALQGLPSARAPRPLADGRPFTVVMTGRMHPHKDYGSVISAARLLASHSAPPAWRFLLIGDGPKRRELEIQAADLVTAGVVEFASPGLEVLPFVGTADVGVLMTNDATIAEGCSNSIMEYMASGLAVVCCDSGGNKELVADGVNGYLVPPGDAADLARRLEQLRADPVGRSRMGAAGNARLLREFSLARMIDAYVGIYDDCVRTTRDLPAGTP
jgi:glycosyltransferase involved in cell wall biosynthesis